LGLLLLLVIGMLCIQNMTGALVAGMFGYQPLAGILGGSVSLSGGHGTTIAWAPVFIEQFGIVRAMEVGIAIATFGLVIGGLLGGPIARFLIQHYNLEAGNEEPIDIGFRYEQKQQQIGVDEVLMVLLAVSVATGLGLYLGQFLEYLGIQLPLFVTCLFAGIVVTNTVPIIFPRMQCPAGKPALALSSELSLGLFLAISLMSIKLWSLSDLAVPILAVLLAQVLAVVIFTVLVVYRLMGRSYEAAVISSGFVGMSLGAVPTAIANMSAVTKRFGAAHMAFVVLPLVGAFFLDISNAVVIKTFLSILG
jgi:ESS family glutamate:Na+ symporter